MTTPEKVQEFHDESSQCTKKRGCTATRIDADLQRKNTQSLTYDKVELHVALMNLSAASVHVEDILEGVMAGTSTGRRKGQEARARSGITAHRRAQPARRTVSS